MLAWAVCADKQHKLPSPPPPVWEELREEIRVVRPRMVILSAEAFSKANRAEIEAIKGKLNGYRVSTVLYLRDPVSYLKSAYRQQVKMGKCHSSFSRFMMERANGVDYQALVERWADVFGASNLHVRMFEKAIKRGLLSDFAQVAGIDEDILVEEVRSNVSPPDEIIRIIRYLNLIEQRLESTVGSKSGRRGFIERVRRRLIRGGSVTRILTVASKLVGQRALHSSGDVTAVGGASSTKVALKH